MDAPRTSCFYISRVFLSRGYTTRRQKFLRAPDSRNYKRPVEVLRGDLLSQIRIDRRLAWIANRETTKEEDIAYSLFGLFDVHIPLLYGERGIKALRRLGDEIEKSLEYSQRGRSTRYDIEYC